MKIEFSQQSCKNTEISTLTTIRPVGAEKFHADRQTHRRTNGRTDRQTDRQRDMTKLIVVFSQFCERA